MEKAKGLKASLRFYFVCAICTVLFLAFALLFYRWRLWKFENIKSLDPIQLLVFLLLFLTLLTSFVCCTIVIGYRRHLKKFHRTLFEVQAKPKPIDTKSKLKELKTIAQDLNRVLDVWDKQFKLKEKELKKELEFEKQKLEGIWENLSDGVILIDTRFNAVFINKALKEVVGDVTDEVRCFEYLENLDKPCELCPLQEALNTNKPQKVIKQLRDTTGQKRYFECTASVLFDQNNNPLGGLLLLKDITRWMEIDSLLEDQSKELDQTKKMLEEALDKLNVAKAKLEETDRFVSLGLSVAEIIHEITNPINFIQASAQNISEHINKLLELFEAYKRLPLLPRAKAELERIEQALNISEVVSEIDKFTQDAVKSAQRVKELVSSLRAFARPTNEMLEVDLREPIEDALVILASQCKEQIKILKYFDEIPKIMGNPSRLIQLFTNIIRNSIQAIEEKGEIVIATKRAQDRVIVEITDTGKGIAPEILPTIFDPFVTTKGSTEKLGLGLAIAKSIVDEHKGNISVQSELNKGTRFVIEFPAMG